MLKVKILPKGQSVEINGVVYSKNFFAKVGKLGHYKVREVKGEMIASLLEAEPAPELSPLTAAAKNGKPGFYTDDELPPRPPSDTPELPLAPTKKDFEDAGFTRVEPQKDETDEK